jgi:hypothetical protein
MLISMMTKKRPIIMLEVAGRLRHARNHEDSDRTKVIYHETNKAIKQPQTDVKTFYVMGQGAVTSRDRHQDRIPGAS